MLLMPIICAPLSQNVIVNDDYLLYSFARILLIEIYLAFLQDHNIPVWI